ncbi:autotransporter outer membrane beta-barrel domain-containing protein [Segnochrobactrum spirostomi]|nr:autotransporter domain-containing protein [Segnochrobactrum spirostomi]
MLGLKIKVGDVTATIGIDTGSTGMVLGQKYWASGFTPVGPAGWVYYNSSGLVVTGIFQTMSVSILGDSQSQQITSLIPILFATGYECLKGATNYCAAGQTGINSPVYNISMLGIGFDRTTMGEGTLPAEKNNDDMKKYVSSLPPTSQAYNLLLNLSEMQSGTMRRGYIITPTGVSLGLTQANTSSENFTYAQLLLQSAGTNGVPNQWQQVQGTITVGGTTSSTTLLMDTGITNAFIDVPNGTAAENNNTVVTISLAGGSASYTFTSGDLTNPQTPYPINASDSGSFVNSSLHTYAGFDVLFDADGGFVGIAANGYSSNTNVTVVPLIAAQGPLNLTQDFETTLPLFLVGASTVNTTATATFDGMIFGANSLTLNGGTIILDGAVMNTGGVTVGQGTTILNATMVGSLTVDPGASFYNVNNGYTVESGQMLTNGGTFVGAQSGDAFVNDGTVVNTGNVIGDVSNAGTWTNDGSLVGAVSNSGTFDNAGSVTGTVTNTGTFFNSGLLTGAVLNVGQMSNSGTIVGDVSTSGSLSNSGLIEGAVVNNFIFSNDGTVLGSVTTSGTLSGNGTVASVLVERGGSVSPGHSLGTVTVTGDATFAPGSLYVAELGSVGTSDHLNVGGTLTAGGATLYLVPGSGFSPALGASYQVFTAGAVASNFTVDNTLFSSAASVYPFLGADLSGAGTLTLSRSTVSYTAFTQTANEWAAASAADRLGDSSPLNQMLAVLNGSEAPATFDGLSGEAYASVQTGLQQQSVYLREAATARVRQAFAKNGEPAAAAASAKTAELVPGLALTAWAQAYGGWGQTEGDGNASTLSRSIGGFLMGIDSPLGEAWRVGLLGGYSQSTFNVDGVNSSADSDKYDLGLYGGARFGDLGLRFGAGYTWHDLSMDRSLAVGGLAETLSSNYQAGTAQVFGEAGYGFHFGATTAEPFADLAYVNLKTDGFTETGGVAALSGDGETFDTTYSVLGLRLGHAVPVATGGALMLTGSLGWQHAYGGLTPTQTAFFAGSSAFTTSGVPIARDTALIDVGFGYNPTPNIDVGLHYDGAFASSTQDSAVKGTLKIRF